ncbi:glycosyltransferase family 2 protein [Kaistella palustris]|uniref:glycosyltransferase family 2 protein n=1 Tax=Kaistella palustris TaxID=493376 RepID=UPI000407474E|nr:glycosyltransferase [Kaistella palustris]
MKISVIVPVYNVEKYLHQCINSIIAQTHRALEIILVNDDSTDNSGKICDEFAELDNRIKVIHQKNGGVSVARNTGIDAASGDYITFVDSDDWIEPEMYENMTQVIDDTNQTDVVMCDYYHVGPEGRSEMARDIKGGLFDKNDIIAQFYPTLLVTEDFGGIPVLSACVCLIKKEILINNEVYFDPLLKFGEDYLFTPAYMVHVNSFFYMKGKFYYNYRQHVLSRSRKFQREWWENFVDLHNKLGLLLENNTKFDFSRQLKLQLIHSAFLSLDRIYIDKSFTDLEKIREIKNIMHDKNLSVAFKKFKFRTRHNGIKIVGFAMKNKMALTYFAYRKLISSVK